MELAGERDRGEDERRHDEAPPLEGEQHRGQEERDEPEQMPGRLPHPVWHQAEDHASDECRRTRDVERAQPPARERPGEHEREEHDEVVRPDVPEQGGKRPVRQAQQPALEVRRRLGLGAEGVRVGQGRGAVLELMTDEPEAPAELQVVAGGRLSVPGRGAGEVVPLDVPDRRPGRPERAGRVQPERHENEAGATGGHEATTVSVAARWSLQHTVASALVAAPPLDARKAAPRAELLGDVRHRADALAVRPDEEPLVHRAPTDEEPAPVGRPDEVADLADAVEERPPFEHVHAALRAVHPGDGDLVRSRGEACRHVRPALRRILPCDPAAALVEDAQVMASQDE